MSKRTERAVQVHEDKANCCQAVLIAMLEDGDITEDDAMRIGACFGSGMGRGDTCGAVVGALMAIGLRQGPAKLGDLDAKKASRQAAADFAATFIERYGSNQCRELLKLNGRRICPELIAGAVGILEESAQ